jgi:TonB-dependent receptor
MSYNITDDLIARFAYAKTYGRPDYADIIPSVTIPEPTMKVTTSTTGGPITAVDEVPGIITVSNTNLQPWKSDNFDFSLEYYHTKGGSISAGLFRKDLSGFWGTKTLNLDGNEALAEEFGIDYAAYQKWQIQSKFNGGKARIDGIEMNIVQPLSNFGAWGKPFNFTANGTVLSLVGPNGSDFSNFIPKTANVGLTYSKKGFVVMVKLNVRGKQRFAKQTGTAYVAPAPTRATTDTDASWAAKQEAYSQYVYDRGGDFYEYYRHRNTIDMNLEYQFSKRLTVFANVRNLLNKAQDLVRQNNATPLYAQQYRTEEYGLQWAVGIKGKF